MKRFWQKRKRLIFLIILPAFLGLSVLTARSLKRAFLGDEVDKRMMRASPLTLWDCGTKSTIANVKNDGCAAIATQLHVPSRVRYNDGGENGQDISALVRGWDGKHTLIRAEMWIVPLHIQEETY